MMPLNTSFSLQTQHDQAMSTQALLDNCSKKAQALLETNSDAQVAHSITQLTTSYHALISNSKDVVKVSNSFMIFQ